MGSTFSCPLLLVRRQVHREIFEQNHLGKAIVFKKGRDKIGFQLSAQELLFTTSRYESQMRLCYLLWQWLAAYINTATATTNPTQPSPAVGYTQRRSHCELVTTRAMYIRFWCSKYIRYSSTSLVLPITAMSCIHPNG